MPQTAPASLALALALVAAPVLAQDALEPLPAPGPRPYPYAVQGVQPGATAEEALAALEAERGRPLDLAPKTVTLRVDAPDGRAFEFAYDARLLSLQASPYGGLARLADPSAEAEEQEERYVLTLSTPAQEGRLLHLSRTMRRPNADLPQPAQLLAQLEGLYGPPSDQEGGGNRIRWTWAWGEDGPIADLRAEPERTMRFDVGDGEPREVEYQPCARHAGTLVEYQFKHPRAEPFMPGCVAVYTVIYEAEPGASTITTALVDFDLARRERDEVDRQIVGALLGADAPAVEPSDLDL